jgi:dTDP-4-dehydrorhamnose 3,5-epimerase
MGSYRLIRGNDFRDERGGLRFFNGFDMREVVRLYQISPASPDILRAWQGHKREKKWFYCISGSFVVYLVKIDNFESPSAGLLPEKISLSADDPAVLEVPGGYASGIKSMQMGSELMVFSNFGLEASQVDDFRYTDDYWPIED